LLTYCKPWFDRFFNRYDIFLLCTITFLATILFCVHTHTVRRTANRNKCSAPKCTCGSDRKFEFQLMPSLLHILSVEKFAPSPTLSSNSEPNSNDIITNKGMNWGVIAVYSCCNSCDESREEYVIVQEPI